MNWESVNGWTPKGGALLGTKRTLPTGKFQQIADNITANKLQGLLLIGGFEAFSTALAFAEARTKHPEFRIPIITIPVWTFYLCVTVPTFTSFSLYIFRTNVPICVLYLCLPIGMYLCFPIGMYLWFSYWYVPMFSYWYVPMFVYWYVPMFANWYVHISIGNNQQQRSGHGLLPRVRHRHQRHHGDLRQTSAIGGRNQAESLPRRDHGRILRLPDGDVCPGEILSSL